MSYWDWTGGSTRIQRAKRMYDEDPNDHHIVRVILRTNIWIVRSQRFPRTKFYRVDPRLGTCTCPDFQGNAPADARFLCKHLYLVDLIRRGGRRQLRPRRSGALLSFKQISTRAGNTLKDPSMPSTRLTLRSGAPAQDPRKMSLRDRALDYARGIARRNQNTSMAPDPKFNPFLFRVVVG